MDTRNEFHPLEATGPSISGSKLLQKSFSIMPKALARHPEDVTKLKPSETKDLFLQIIDYEKMKKGPESVVQEERTIQEYLDGTTTVTEDKEFESDLDEERYLEYARSHIKRVLDSEKNQYDAISGLAFYTDDMRKRIVNSLLQKQQIHGGIPQFKVIVADVNELHEINNSYGHEQGDRVLAATGDGIKNSIGNLSFKEDSEVYAGRMKGTGDTFVIVVIDEDAEKIRVEDMMGNYHYSSWSANGLKTGRSEKIAPSVRIESISSFDMDTGMDLGGMLDSMIRQAQTNVDIGGHERKENV